MAQKKKNRSLPRKERTTGGRNPSLGYYLIVTDGKKTEKNYFEGLKNHIPEALKNRLAIVVQHVKNTKDLIDCARQELLKSPQKREIWIVFDRDEVPDFDQFVAEAQNLGFQVGWSHPCIELWFHAYLGEMPQHENSRRCTDAFRKAFQKKSGKGYRKTDADIYQRLREHGDEKQAIELATRRMKEYKGRLPSTCPGATMVHQLIEEIADRIERRKQ